MNMFKQLEINILFANALAQIPNYIKFMKEIMSSKKELEAYGTVNLFENYNAIIKEFPGKLKDQGSFTIPCNIGEHTFSKALCDLGASINLMTFSIAKKLNLGEITPIALSLQMADRSMNSPISIIEDVLIKVGKFIFPVDFVVLVMEEDEKVLIILGKPFLATSRELIDVESGELTLRGDDKVCLSICKSDKLQKKENGVWMRVEAIPVHGVENMKKVPKEATVKSLSVTSPSEEQRGRKLNSSINSKVDQNEMVPFPRKVDVICLLVEGIEKSTTVKTKKKKHKTSILPKNLISACFGNHEQEPAIHSPG